MNAPVDIPKDLVTIPPENAMQIFTSKDGEGLEPFLALIRARIDAWVPPDLGTAKGRKEVASFAYKIAQSKGALEEVGKALAAEAKEIPKQIDASRKMVRDRLDEWRDEVRKPLDDWEAAEEARIKKHVDEIETLKLLGAPGSIATVSMLESSLYFVDQVEIGHQCEEFEAEYARAKDQATKSLKLAIADRQKYEAEQVELEKLRREAAERAAKDRDEAIRREAAEKATKAAEAAAQAERDKIAAADAAERERLATEARREREAGERRELELKLAAEAGARQALETEARLKDEAAAAERRAQETEARLKREAQQAAAAEAAAIAAREADKNHKGAVNRAAVQALVAGGISEEIARAVITLIAKKAIPAIAISY